MSIIFLCFYLLSCPIPALYKEYRTSQLLEWGRGGRFRGKKRKHQEGKNSLASQNVISPHLPHLLEFHPLVNIFLIVSCSLGIFVVVFVYLSFTPSAVFFRRQPGRIVTAPPYNPFRCERRGFAVVFAVWIREKGSPFEGCRAGKR